MEQKEPMKMLVLWPQQERAVHISTNSILTIKAKTVLDGDTKMNLIN